MKDDKTYLYLAITCLSFAATIAVIGLLVDAGGITGLLAAIWRGY